MITGKDIIKFIKDNNLEKVQLDDCSYEKNASLNFVYEKPYKDGSYFFNYSINLHNGRVESFCNIINDDNELVLTVDMPNGDWVINQSEKELVRYLQEAKNEEPQIREA